MFQPYRDFLSMRDPRLKNYYLMSSPIPIFTIAILYLLFVLKIGPKWMENRNPFKLKRVLQIYNITQIVANLIICFGAILYLPNHSFLCPTLCTDSIEINLCYGYVLTKLLDLLDTVFFIMRKKFNQVTFLHVYHHTMMTIVPWLHVFIYPGGPAVYTGTINTFVHAAMYFYYYMTSFSKKNIWWKKYITQLQIVQHFLALVNASASLLNRNCSYSKIASLLIAIQAAHMIYMFSKFYVKTYLKDKKRHE